MDNKQKEFIWLAFGEKIKYDVIAKRLDVQRKTLTQWTRDLRSEWKPITEIYKTYSSKGIKVGFKRFHDHYLRMKLNYCCEYCGITEEEISSIKPNTKRTRGKKLELDRKEPNDSYNNLDNLVFACYWCNNAKTDTFSHDEFLKVGKVISSIWKERLKNDKR